MREEEEFFRLLKGEKKLVRRLFEVEGDAEGSVGSERFSFKVFFAFRSTTFAKRLRARR